MSQQASSYLTMKKFVEEPIYHMCSRSLSHRSILEGHYFVSLHQPHHRCLRAAQWNHTMKFRVLLLQAMCPLFGWRSLSLNSHLLYEMEYLSQSLEAADSPRCSLLAYKDLRLRFRVVCRIRRSLLAVPPPQRHHLTLLWILGCHEDYSIIEPII